MRTLTGWIGLMLLIVGFDTAVTAAENYWGSLQVDDGVWTVQLGIFNSEDAALRFSEKFASRRKAVCIGKDSRDGKFRVFYLAFDKKEWAEEIKKDEGQGVVVFSNFISPVKMFSPPGSKAAEYLSVMKEIRRPPPESMPRRDYRDCSREGKRVYESCVQSCESEVDADQKKWRDSRVGSSYAQLNMQGDAVLEQAVREGRLSSQKLEKNRLIQQGLNDFARSSAINRCQNSCRSKRDTARDECNAQQ